MADQATNNTPDNLDVVQHPVLGTLRFPKDMGFDERNNVIQRHLQEHAAQQEQKAQATPIAGTSVTAPAAPKEGESTFQEKLGSLVPQGAMRPLAGIQKWAIDPLEKLAHAGTEAGEKAGKAYTTLATHPIETVKQFSLGQAFNPSGKEGELLKRTSQEHPIATGVAEGVGGVLGGLAFDPRNYPFLLGQGGALAGKTLLKRAIDTGFAANMGKGVVDGALNLYNNWDAMSPEERTKSITELGMQSFFTAQAARGAVASHPNYGGAEGFEPGAYTEAKKGEVPAAKPGLPRVEYGTDESAAGAPSAPLMQPGEVPEGQNFQRTPAPETEQVKVPYRESTPLGVALQPVGELPEGAAFERTAAPETEQVRAPYREGTPYVLPITPEEAAKSAEKVGAKGKTPLGTITEEVTKNIVPEISKAVEKVLPKINLEKPEQVEPLKEEAASPMAAKEAEALGKINLEKSVPEFTEVTGHRLGVPTEAPADFGIKVRAEAPPMPRGERRARVRTPEEEATTELFRQARKELGEDATNEQIDARMEELKAAKGKVEYPKEPGLVGSEYTKEEHPPSAADVAPDIREQVGNLSQENLRKLASAHGLDPSEYGDFKRDRVYNPEKRRYDISPGRTRLADDIVSAMSEEEKSNLGTNIRELKSKPEWADRDMSGKGRADLAAGFFPRLRGEAEVGAPKPEAAKEAPKTEVPAVAAEVPKEEAPKAVESPKTGDQYKDAVQLVANTGKAAASILQKGLGIGYSDAVKLIDRMEQEGVIASAEGAGARKIAKLPEWAQSAKSAAYGESNTGVTKPEYDQAKKDFNKKIMGGLKTGIPFPAEEISKMAQFHIEAGARSFADWSKKMIEDLGDSVKPYLANVWRDNYNHVVPSPTEPVIVPPRESVSGGKVSRPYGIYHEAALSEGNPWVRRSVTHEGTQSTSNENRQLLVQISSDLINKKNLESSTKDISEEYYDKLYSGKREGYSRMADFWEIPQWIGFAAHMMPDSDVYVVRDVDEAKKFLNEANYGHVAFSALDVNKDIIKQVIDGYKGKVAVGGYVDRNTFFGNPNVTWHDSLGSMAKEIGLEPKNGVDYRHFQGSDVIPRLTMSDGCLHKCAFCVIPKEIKLQDEGSLNNQADAISKLGTKLVYVSDKTFGQAKNYEKLAEINEKMKKENPDFKGFIVQTTAAQLKKITPEFLKKSGIKFVELGIESYNDPLLKEMHKPATEKIIDESVDKLRKNGIALIPNILIGYPGETAETYAHTLDFLNKNKDIISHANIYNLALYKDTELGQKMTTATDGDFNENVLEKSWYNGSDIHQTFAGDLYNFASKMLDKVPTFDEETKASAGDIPPRPIPTRRWPSIDSLINKYGEAPNDPAHVSFIGPDGRAVAQTGKEHDVMLGGKPRDDFRTPFINETGAIRMRSYGAYGGRQFGMSLPETGVTESQLEKLKKLEPMMRTGRQYIEVANPELNRYDVIDQGDKKSLEDVIRSLVPIRPDDNPVNNTLNASGESSASKEALNRVASEKSQGIKRLRIKQSGEEIPLIGPDAVDAKAGKGETIVKRYADGHEEIQDQGQGARYNPKAAQVWGGTKESAERDQELYKQAKKELGEDAPVSKLLLRAQELKTQGAEKPLKAVRADDFSSSGEYDVRSGDNHAKIYRDPESGWWYESPETGGAKHFTALSLGFTKQEALDKLAERWGSSLKTKSQATSETAQLSDVELKKQGYTQEQIDSGLHLPRVKGGSTAKEEGIIPEELGQHLHPEERAGLKTPITQQKFVDTANRLPEVKEFVDIANQAAGERKWYQRGTAAVKALSKELPDYFKEGDTTRFLDLVAALSPRQAIAENMTEALRVWKEYVDQERPEETKPIKKLLRENIGINRGSKIPNAMKALSGEDMWPDLKKNRYFKVPSFSKNLNGFLDKVTSDGWIGAFADVNEKEIQHPAGYHALSVATRAAADELGWEPAEAQAAVWAFVKTLTEKGETEPKEIRALSKDFADILKEDDDIQEILKEMGIDHASFRKRLEREVPEKPELSGQSTPTTKDSIRKLVERLQRQGREIPEPKSNQGKLGFEEEGDTSFNPEEFEMKPLGEKKSKLGKAK